MIHPIYDELVIGSDTPGRRRRRNRKVQLRFQEADQVYHPRVHRHPVEFLGEGNISDYFIGVSCVCVCVCVYRCLLFAGDEVGTSETRRLECGGGRLGRRFAASLHSGHSQHTPGRPRTGLLHQPSQGNYNN